MKKMMLIIAMCLFGCGGEIPEQEGYQTANQGLQTSFASVFGWGSFAANESKTSTSGPGPQNPNTPIKCYTEALPTGFDFSCMSPAPGAIQMKVKNNNGYSVNLGNRWHGAVY